MKTYCRIENDVIDWPQMLPNQYKNVIGGFDQLSDFDLIKYGFYPYVEPEFSSTMQELGELIFIAETKIVTRTVKDRVFDIESLLQNKLSEFEQFQKNFRKEITELFLEEIALGTLSDDVKRFIVLLQERKTQIIAELQGFYDTANIERLLNYSFYTDEAEQFKMALTMMKD